jgi:hypothetical protein
LTTGIARVTGAGLAALALAGTASAQTGAAPERPVPAQALSIMQQPKYAGAIWGVRVVDVESGRLVSSLGPDSLFFTGSVRKLFSVRRRSTRSGPGTAS